MVCFHCLLRHRLVIGFDLKASLFDDRFVDGECFVTLVVDAERVEDQHIEVRLEVAVVEAGFAEEMEEPA